MNRYSVKMGRTWGDSTLSALTPQAAAAAVAADIAQYEALTATMYDITVAGAPVVIAAYDNGEWHYAPLYNFLPSAVVAGLNYLAARHELEYADNFRAYRDRDEIGKAIFIEQDASGCCGSFESSTIIDGVKWFIGCNYGH